MSKYSQFFAIIKKLDLTKEEVVKEFTKGRTDRLSALKNSEFNELMDTLQQFNSPPPGDAMRKKMIGIAKSMNWGRNTKDIIASIDTWLLKQKYKKTMMQHQPAELSIMLTILETKVYPEYLQQLNK